MTIFFFILLYKILILINFTKMRHYIFICFFSYRAKILMANFLKHFYDVKKSLIKVRIKPVLHNKFNARLIRFIFIDYFFHKMKGLFNRVAKIGEILLMETIIYLLNISIELRDTLMFIILKLLFRLFCLIGVIKILLSIDFKYMINFLLSNFFSESLFDLLHLKWVYSF